MSSYLPEEIIMNILSRLQVKSLLRFRCVSKSWCNLLTSNNHDFVRMHLNHALDHEKNNNNNNNNNNNCSIVLNYYDEFYSIDSVSSSSSSSESCYKIEPPFKSRLSDYTSILASCNGLLCIANYVIRLNHPSRFFIWNPSTKEYKELSLPTPITSEESRSEMAYGFGYDCKIDDYKFVSIVNLEVNVYTLGSSSWRSVQSVLHNHFVPNQQVGVFLNGALHWINESHRTTTGSQVLFSFDISNERFHEIELPKKCLVGECIPNVGVLSGDLCVLVHTHEYDYPIAVWVMKDYGVVESWTKLFSISRETASFSHYLKAVHSFKNGEILSWVGLRTENYFCTSTLVSYDPKHERARTLKIQGIPKHFVGIETFVGSLVSPNRLLL